MDTSNLHSVEICGSESIGNNVVYTIRITGASGSRDVHRRYHEFADLEEKIQDALPGLPPMPPKSIIHKYFSPLDSSFMIDRAEKLNEFIQKAVKADPNVATFDLRVFLGVGLDDDAKDQAAWDRELSLKMWDEFERRWQSKHVDHTAEKLRSFTWHDLESTLGSLRIMPSWKLMKWKRTRTLASAASGQGIVDLMTRREMPSQTVAVKKLPWKLIRSSPEDFKSRHPDAPEQPWTDIGVVKYLNSLHFPWTCKFLGAYLGFGHAYVMTSFANRGDLFTWCQHEANAAIEVREVAMQPIVRQIVTAVCWLHDLGIAHRDLSLENVMLHDTGGKELEVKIIDFGMSTLDRFSQQVRGKRSYQAPEMHLGEYDTFVADIFSVGVIFYCLAVHHYPWKTTRPGRDKTFGSARESGLEVFFQKKKLPSSDRTVAEVFSKSFLDVLCALMAIAPESRYSLGEACFHQKHANACLSPRSSASTTASVSTFDEHWDWDTDVCSKDCDTDDDKVHHTHLRLCIWGCDWFSARRELPASD